MLWTEFTLENVRAAFAARRGADDGPAISPAAPLDLAAARRAAAERRDLAPYLAMVAAGARAQERRVARRGGGAEVVPFRRCG